MNEGKRPIFTQDRLTRSSIGEQPSSAEQSESDGTSPLTGSARLRGALEGGLAPDVHRPQQSFMIISINRKITWATDRYHTTSSTPMTRLVA